MREIEVKFSDAKTLICKAFPGLSSRRTVKVIPRSIYSVMDYWSEGNRYECRFVELATGRVMSSAEIPYESLQKMGNPYNLPMCDVTLTSDYAVVEHVIFRGKSLGFRIYVAPERFESALALGEGDQTMALLVASQKLLTA